VSSAAASFNDDELEAFIRRHNETIHTREFPSRCGTCRLFARLKAAEKAVQHGDYCDCPKGECTYDAWRVAAGKS
jgi:hypothetical protein